MKRLNTARVYSKKHSLSPGKTITKKIPGVPVAQMNGCVAIGRKGVSPAAKIAMVERVNSTVSEIPAILPPGTNDEQLSLFLNGWSVEGNPLNAESGNGPGRLPNPQGYRGGGDE